MSSEPLVVLMWTDEDWIEAVRQAGGNDLLAMKGIAGDKKRVISDLIKDEAIKSVSKILREEASMVIKMQEAEQGKELRQITEQELEEILEKHRLWVRDKPGGERADLTDADLRGIDLREALLSSAACKGACFDGVDMRGSNISAADMRGASFRMTKMHGSYARGTRFNRAEISRSNMNKMLLREADFSKARIENTDMDACDLRDAIAKEAILDGVKIGNPFGDLAFLEEAHCHSVERTTNKPIAVIQRARQVGAEEKSAAERINNDKAKTRAGREER
ncbi:MAG: pentapeptide repeat-containing protein [Eggerthellaceae bacterium]|nr:pentapeptide repeat-containing protein [Eggerthellaceae bacterium]